MFNPISMAPKFGEIWVEKEYIDQLPSVEGSQPLLNLLANLDKDAYIKRRDGYKFYVYDSNKDKELEAVKEINNLGINTWENPLPGQELKDTINGTGIKAPFLLIGRWFAQDTFNSRQ